MTDVDRPAPPAAEGVRTDFVRGVTWAMVMRWSIRGIGFVSTVILARLLTPEDFGVAAMGMLVIQLLEKLSELGTSSYLIRARSIDDAHRDTAWTMTVLQGFFVAALLVLMAEPAAAFFSEPRLVAVLQALSVAAAASGFVSIGTVLARRNLEFDKDFRFHVIQRLTIFFTTVGLAWWLRDYRALVAGYVGGAVVSVFVSYALFRYRPRFTLARAPEYARFAVYVVPMRLAQYITESCATFVIGAAGSSAAVGTFTVARGLASMATDELITPMGRGLYPNYAKLAHDPPALAAVYLKVIGITALISLPLGLGTCAVAREAVAIVLGPKWSEAVVLVQVLAIAGTLAALTKSLTAQILVVTGNERSATILLWLRLGLTVPLVIIGADQGNALGVSVALVVSHVVCMPITYLATSRAVTLERRSVLAVTVRPVTAGVLMFVLVTTFPWLEHLPLLPRFALQVILGALGYSGAILVLWLSERIKTGLLEAILPQVPTIIVVTTLALLLGQLRFIRNLEGAWELGHLAFYVFFAAVGAMIHLYNAIILSPILFAYVMIIIAVHMVTIYGAGRLLRMDVGVLTVASAAAKTGPPTALAIAEVKGWKALELPAVIMGLVGYAVGNYIGLGTAYLIKALLAA